ncbi:MAG: hypothetical protein ABSG68_26800 [Thermoguttaceae bacterium]|jgi:hypothetical protein
MLVRVRLLMSCLAGPDGIKFRGHEVAVSPEQALLLVASRQWEYVLPPQAAEPRDESQESRAENATAGLPSSVPNAPRPRREFRGRPLNTENRKPAAAAAAIEK